MKLLSDTDLAKVRDALNELRYANDTDIAERKLWEAIDILDKLQEVEVVGWRNNINYCIQFRSDEMTPQVVSGYMTPQWTWLYAAIKGEKQ